MARRGVPQGRHVHALTARGGIGLEKLFPGFLDELTAAGVPHGDAQNDEEWYLDGHKMARASAGLPVYFMTRPVIEHVIRQRVRALPNVTFVSGADVTGLIAQDGRITGVRAGEVLPADLVVDATGRGSRAPHWLGELGYPVPDETTLRTDTVYVTRLFKGRLDGLMAALAASYPGHHRAGTAIRQENDQIAVMLVGLLGEEPPTDDEGMLAYASTLPAPQIAEVLRTAEPLGDAAKMRYPASSRKHFEKLDRHLEGLIVVGDALCSLNPIYGQGQTMAVLEAELLESVVEAGPERLTERFYRANADVLDDAWRLVAGGDLRFPEVEGERSPRDVEAGKYLTRYRAAAAVDPVLGGAFLRVSNMVAPIASLFAPEMQERVRAADRQ
ncbi:squalene monooxygenase [Actinoplanes sp. TBRC 11911]|uniref:FAD-dependent oxidoreductase n=1 Tax=Actinoplanes sp. TBRC 11911 TaxID=2729386 RepID=UPI00145D8D18|nr:squalene monooxygenase [Actinoplanes sp. TBRC 11911]NMO50294.1 squalene monooxygenase [Actinoplanes sp. TBRC 11911]